MLRCARCKKTGLEEDFAFDEKERPPAVYCYECAPEDVMRQWWPVDDEEELNQQEESVEK